jgi:hypothetical protein
MLLLVLISSLLFLALISFAVFRGRQLFHSAKSEENYQLPPPPLEYKSLFNPDPKVLAEIEREKHRKNLDEQREKLLAWASVGHFSALPEVLVTDDEKLFQEVFEILTERATTEEEIRFLATFILENEKTSVNQSLINKFEKIWENAPNAEMTVQLFHLAGLNGDANFFLQVVNKSVQFLKTGKLSNFTLGVLAELAESHYWLLNDSARTSGTGFMLKQKLADLRREIAQ